MRAKNVAEYSTSIHLEINYICGVNAHNSVTPVCQAIHSLYAYIVSLPTAEMMPTIYDEAIVNIRSCLAYIATFSPEITVNSIRGINN